MIKALHLQKSFGDFAAVRDISFTVEQGQIAGFLGPNGAGKTTTLRMLTTFSPITGGSAMVAGYDVATQSDEVRRHIGYLPETPPLYPELTVEENLVFTAEIKGLSRRAIKGSVEVALERCALTDVRHKLCRYLSKGYRQRVGIAQAIVHEPKVIVLDEPTSGLDPKQIIEIRGMIKSLSKNHTVLLSTHILPEVSAVCDKVIIVNRGHTVLEKDLAELSGERSLEQLFIDVISKDQSVTHDSVVVESGAV